MTAPKSLRIWYAFMGALLWAGIWLTGFANVYWLIYLPAVAFIFSAITGICPSQVLISKMLGVKITETSNQ